MRRLQGSWSWLVMAALVVAGCVTTNEKTGALRTGVTAEIKGEFNDAIETYTATLDNATLSDQERALFQNRRAQSYIAKGEFDKAIGDADQVIRERPDWEIGYNTRALAYAGKQQYEMAIADLDVSLRLRPQPAAYRSRGAALALSGHYDEAVADLDQAVRLAPRSSEAYLTRGNVYLQHGDYQRALSDFDQSIGLQPDNAEAYNGRGSALGRMGQYDKAYQEFATALIFQPKAAAIYSNRGHMAAAMGKFDTAAADLARSVALTPNGYDMVWLYLFRHKAKQDNSDELSRNIAALKQQPWAQAISSVYLGTSPPDQLRKMAEQASGDGYTAAMCQAVFHTGYYHLLHGETAAAKPALQEAAKTCPATSTEQRFAANELKAIR